MSKPNNSGEKVESDPVIGDRVLEVNAANQVLDAAVLPNPRTRRLGLETLVELGEAWARQQLEQLGIVQPDSDGQVAKPSAPRTAAVPSLLGKTVASEVERQDA